MTFGYQGLPFGINTGKGKSAAATTPMLTTWALMGVLGAMVFGLGL